MKKTILDSALDEIRGDIKFLPQWTPEQFKKIEAAITRHFTGKIISTLHGSHPRNGRLRFSQVDSIMGLAYTSSSSFAGYWVCNTEVYNPKFPGFNYNGFAISTGGDCYGILNDAEENEIFIRL